MNRLCQRVTAAVAVPLAAMEQAQPTVSRRVFVDTGLNKDGFVDLDELHKDVDLRLSFREVVEGRMDFFDMADMKRDERLSPEQTLVFDAGGAQRASAAAQNKWRVPW